MRQPGGWRVLWAGVAVAVLAGAGCRQPEAEPGRAKAPTVVSLVPAATDLLIGMGAQDHLLAVSNYDVDRPETRNLPRAGDYQSIDWERVGALRPGIMIVFMSPQRMPAGLKQRAEQLGIRLLNVRTERLSEILDGIGTLGRAVDEQVKASAALERLNGQIETARRHAQGRPRTPTLIVRDENAEAVVGRDNFLHDLLEAAGGTNVISEPGWPVIDRERLLSLRPEVIIQLLPGASPQILEKARRFWVSVPSLPAVASGRVHVLSEWYVQQPGSHVGELALRFSRILHPHAWTGSEQ